MISSDDASGQILQTWKNGSASLRITVQVSNGSVLFAGGGKLSSFGPDGIGLSDGPSWSLGIKFDGDETVDSSFPTDDPGQVVIIVTSGPTKCALVGAQPGIPRRMPFNPSVDLF